MGLASCGSLGARLWNSLWLIAVDPHRGGSISLRPASVLDLKADCRGYKYMEETIRLLPEKPAPILLAKILNRVAGLGRIHTAQPSFSFS
jgi:hypothetical protein